ncbi:gas vesicle protein GvpL/GvpF [Yoonia maricola]|uniref:Gas vesicle protein GvpL/GvpF n=1 Tax=Yoonia maricola TaxID=420999 RepID=A0A2M8WKI1_9RHOB|nr:GvpL/GvpF family gas vesicle protein [Yoonia maricola]PJI91428.1 gas vesicle protein GvpL/GvpF [Yoonia maricola]
MTVLGWTRHRTNLPSGVRSLHCGDWTILVSDDPSIQTARHRLAAQVSCFDAGLDFLPTAPAQNIAIYDATSFTRTTDLDALWRKLSDRGQFSVAVRMAADQEHRTQDGRSWLKTRQAQRQRQRHCGTMLADIVAHLKLPTTQPRHTENSASCDVLVQRDDTNRVHNAMQHLARLMQGPPDMRLCVTGLWPPFGFVDLTSKTEAAE